MNQHRASYAAAPGGVEGILYGNIIVHNHIVGIDILVLGHIDSHLKVHDIAGIILHNAENALVSSHCLDSLINLVRGRRSKYGTCHCAIQHALAHITAMSWLVAAAAAADQGNLSLLLPGTDNHVAALQLPQLVRSRFYQAQNHFFLYVLNCINNLLHNNTLLASHTFQRPIPN